MRLSGAGWMDSGGMDVLTGKDDSLEKCRANLGGVCEKLQDLVRQGT